MLALDTKNLREQLRIANRSGFMSRQCNQLLRGHLGTEGGIHSATAATELALQREGHC